MWLNNVWGSVQRALGILSDKAKLTELEDGSLQAVVFFTERPTSKDVHEMRSYVRAYSKECGWKVSSVRVEGDYLVLAASKAESSSDKNL